MGWFGVTVFDGERWSLMNSCPGVGSQEMRYMIMVHDWSELVASLANHAYGRTNYLDLEGLKLPEIADMRFPSGNCLRHPCYA